MVTANLTPPYSHSEVSKSTVKTTRGRHKSLGSLVFTSRGQEYIIGYCEHGQPVTVTLLEAQRFTLAFITAKRSLRGRMATWLYNKYALDK